MKNVLNAHFSHHPERQYLNYLSDLVALSANNPRDDRTGVRTYSVFGIYQMYFDLKLGFPILTTKKIPFRLIASELQWFLKGDTNIRWLLEHNNHIWSEWPFQNYLKATDQAHLFPMYQDVWKEKLEEFEERVLKDEEFALTFGSIGDAYGYQWRSWPNHRDQGKPIDQIHRLIEDLTRNPFSRRHIISAWNPADIDFMSLPPCHTLFQFYVTEDGRLDCKLYQRSADWFLGVPFNISSYALLISLIAKVTHLTPGNFIHTFGDAHLYSNHIQPANTQLSRNVFPLPELLISEELIDLDSFDHTKHISLLNYQSHPAIKADIAV